MSLFREAFLAWEQGRLSASFAPSLTGRSLEGGASVEGGGAAGRRGPAGVQTSPLRPLLLCLRRAVRNQM